MSNGDRNGQTYTEALQEVYDRLEGVEENKKRIDALERAIFKMQTTFENFEQFMRDVKAMNLDGFVGRVEGELLWIKLLVGASALAAVADMILRLLGVE